MPRRATSKAPRGEGCGSTASRSRTTTSWPARATASEAASPATPPPATTNFTLPSYPAIKQSASPRGRTRAYAGSLATMTVRALVFDVFGTLVDWRSGVAEAFRAGGVAGDPEELADAWRARYRPILAEVNEGSRPWGNFDDLHLVTLDDLLAERGLDVSLEERR